MKSSLIALLLIFPFSSRAGAQNIAGLTSIDRTAKDLRIEPTTSDISVNGLSPLTALLWLDLKGYENGTKEIDTRDSVLMHKYRLIQRDNRLYANAFLIVKEGFDISELDVHGFLNGSVNGTIATGLVPVNGIDLIANHHSVTYLQIGDPVQTMMNEARSTTWTDWVHQGYQLPQAYSGAGVIVGVIDGGFDYTHPNFYDSTYSNYRVKRVWEQNSSGTPPNGFSYGIELSTQSTILSAQTDNPGASHGTHVAGIATGGGAGTNSKYLGAAPASDIVLVSYGGSSMGVTASVFDGIQYIINYANSVNKPCVINMSLGTHVGPHDGTSLFDQACDNVVGNGRLLVGAAGNDGLDSLYLQKSFTSSDTLLFSFLQFNNATFSTQNDGLGTIDIWGEPNKTYWVSVNLWNSSANQFEDWTPYISATSGITYRDTLYDDDFFFPDTCYVGVSTEVNPLNDKPHIYIEVDNRDQDDDYRWVLLEVIAYDGQTKIWGGPANVKTTFTRLNYAYPVIPGSINSTMREIGGTGKSIISVGAYTSKNSWTAFNGNPQTRPFNNGELAPFSSHGPTADNRTKPDITAPGNVIASSVNRFDNTYTSTNNEVVAGVTDGTNDWWFATMQGTSMAAPMVTGILALWLEAYPYLNLEQAKQLLKDNAWTDGYTGSIPPNGSNIWGWGKMDAHEGLLDLLTKIPAKPTISPAGTVSFCQGESVQLVAPAGFTNYLWSNNATTRSITVSTVGTYSVRLSNNQGYISPWSDSKTVTVHANPPKPSITVNGNELTSSASSGNQWYYNGTIIPGATQKSYTAHQSGNYSIVVTTSNNCSTSSNPKNITITGISTLVYGIEVLIYPNPSQGEINIRFARSHNDVAVQVYDVMGKVVKKRVLNVIAGRTEVLDLQGMESGVYSLHFEIGGVDYSNQICIVR